MSIIDFFDAYDDVQISHLLKGKSMELKLKNRESIKDVITNFLNAAQTGDSNRKIIGIIINEEHEIILSQELIESINLL